MDGVRSELRSLFLGLKESVLGNRLAAKALPQDRPDLDRDLPLFLAMAVGFFVLSWGLRLLIVEPLARAAKMKHVHVVKCAQSVTEVLFYGSFSFIGLMVVPSQEWVWPSRLWFDGHSKGEHLLMRTDLRCYYFMYVARYAQMFFSVLLEPKRKDFLEMLVHHALTVVIIYMSYTCCFTRVGVVVMLLLDPADVPLHLAKICKYVLDVTNYWVWQFLANRLFEAFAAVFLVTRIILFGYVCFACFLEGPQYIPNYGGAGGKSCIAILFMLLALQLYWLFLILKVALKLARDGKVEDVRSDDEGPAEEAPPPRRRTWSPRAVLAVGLLVFLLVSYVLLTPEVRAELEVLLPSLAAALVGPSSRQVMDMPRDIPQLRRDASIFIIFAGAIFIFNWSLRLLIVEPLARSILKLKRAPLVKFAQSVMEAVIYGSFAFVGLRIVPSQPWVWPSSNWWKDFTSGSHNWMRADMRCFYILYISRYFQALLSVLMEPRRKDFVEMMLHHIVTVTVIFISYIYGWNRVGMVVMVLLDPADVPLHLAKLCKYIAMATTGSRHIWQIVADRLFEIFAVVFLVTRLVLYSYVCWSAHVEASDHFTKGFPEWACVALLYTLLLLQVYWFFLIVKVAVKLLSGEGVEDPRSDDEDETSRKKR
mmetsp:Transcript_40191/g.87839  ORF Transcript_40191/g.87839 Transcript_40191/m.87839 type:complete len:648 (-) Transcript_40191:99-2042(-)